MALISEDRLDLGIYIYIFLKKGWSAHSLLALQIVPFQLLSSS